MEQTNRQRDVGGDEEALGGEEGETWEEIYEDESKSSRTALERGRA